MATHETRIAEYRCVAVSTHLTLGFGVIQYAWRNSVQKHSFENFQICLSFELAGKNYNLD